MKITRTGIALQGEHQRREAIRSGGAWLGFDQVLAQEQHAQPAAKATPGALPSAGSAAQEANLLILRLMIKVFGAPLGAGERSPECPLTPVRWRRDTRGALPVAANDTVDLRIAHGARRPSTADFWPAAKRAISILGWTGAAIPRKSKRPCSISNQSKSSRTPW